MSKLYTTKNTGLGTGSIKDINAKEGVITGYFASFDTLDSDGDVFTNGAFKKSISENKHRIMHLLQHDVTKPIGRPSMLMEDTKGLYFETKLSAKQLEVGYIADTLKLYEAGVYNEHSVGFITMQEHRGQKDDKSVNFITEAKLMEGSVVTWGANENTPVIGIKGEDKKSILDEIDKICKAMRVGNLTDDSYIGLEIRLQQVKSLLSQVLEPGKTTLDISTTEDEQLIDLLSQINI